MPATAIKMSYTSEPCFSPQMHLSNSPWQREQCGAGAGGMPMDLGAHPSSSHAEGSEVVKSLGQNLLL